MERNTVRNSEKWKNKNRTKRYIDKKVQERNH